MRAGAAVAVKFVGAFLERIHHLAKGAVDVLTRKRLEHDVLEAEIDGKIDVAAILSAVSESPVVVQIAKRFKGYFRVTVPAKAYGLAQDTITIGARNGLIVNADLDNKLVYQIIKTIDQNLDTVKKIHPSLKKMNRKIWAKSSVPVPYHPGAIRYYKEVGLLK